MDKVYIGFVQGVHGLRGDLKIKCEFEKPDKVFITNNHIYLNDEEHAITNAKFYKGHYLVTIDNMRDINLVEKYIGYEVYFNRDDLNESEGEYILADLYGLKIISSNHEYGEVCEIFNNGVYKILKVKYSKDYMIPLVDEYVKKVDVKNGYIEVDDVEGLIL